MKILICGRDIWPSKSLARIAVEAVNRGHSVRAALFQSLSDWLSLLDWNPDIVLTVPSTADWQDTFVLSRVAKNIGIPLSWFCDTYSVFRRPDYAELRSDIIFVPDAVEAQRAREYGYPKVVASGVPFWEDFRDVSRYLVREEARHKFGIASEQIAVMFLGVKNSKVTLRALQDAVTVLQRINAPFVFIPCLHPGDENAKSGFYEKFFAGLALSWVNAASHVQAPDSLLMAVDLVVGLCNTAGIACAYINWPPVIDFMPDYMLDNIEAQIGERIWIPAESGATFKASSVEELEQAIKSLLTPEGQNALFARQREIYPADLPKGNAVKIIVNELEKLVQQKLKKSN